MMLTKLDSGKNGSEESKSGQLLRDIEAISKALYLHNTPSLKSLIPTSENRSKSAGKTRLLDSKLKKRAEDESRKDKKSSMWNWKKPLKALSHIRHRKINCCFYLHIHSIEGLPSDFNNIGLCVNWKRKDEILRTRPMRVDQGMAEFEETLTYQCSVYGHKSGPENSAKYESLLSLVYPSIVGGMDLDIGKHWIDLTKLLPLTLEDLEDDKNSEKWTTSFKLIGKAKGAILNVSFGFSVMGNTSFDTESNMGILFPSNLNQEKSSREQNIASFGDGKLRRGVSVPNMLHMDHISSQSMDVKVLLHGFIENPEFEISRSINDMYKEIEDTKWSNRIEFEENFGNECDDIEFTVIDKGIELSTKEEFNSEECSDQIFDDSVVETNNAYENTKIDEVASKERTNENSKDSAMEFETFLGLESVDLNDPLIQSENPAHEEHMERKLLLENENSNYRKSQMVKSLSLDDVTESIASDFLNMLHVDHSPFGLTSDSDPESPRERLLRQFANETLASGTSIFNIDASVDEVEFDYNALIPSGSDFVSKNLDLSINNQAFEQNQKRERPSLMSKRKAKILEKLETESLMRECGFNERTFQNSPRYSGGFGSPIYIPCEEETAGLPALGEGVGPLLKTKNGGFLRSMTPSIFRNVKNGSRLIMQVSTPIVLRAEFGCDIKEIQRYWASIGIEELSSQLNNVLPLEDITGKTMRQVAWEAASILEVPDTESKGKEVTELHSNLLNGEMGASAFVSLKDFVSLAMDKIEHLSIEGLRIQSGISLEEAPMFMYPSFLNNDLEVNKLLGMSVKLEEWLKLHTEDFSMIMSLMVQLRDPLRNYEPVGAPMVALFQVETVHTQDDTIKMKDVISRFMINEVFVVGIDSEPEKKHFWGTKTQKQYGHRWLLSSGMGKTYKHPYSKSKPIVKVSSLAFAKKQTRDTMWSISLCIQGTIRNPDIIFIDETTRL